MITLKAIFIPDQAAPDGIFAGEAIASTPEQVAGLVAAKLSA